MRLSQLIEGIDNCRVAGDLDVEVKGLAYDSRKVKPGYLFVAIKGHRLDGHQFVEEAIGRGACGVVVQDSAALDHDMALKGGNRALIRVPDSRRALSRLSVNYYGRPFERLALIGITGTNGKTTTTYLLESILREAGAEPGVIGTINYRFKGRSKKAPVTTPESLDLMEILNEMAEAGVSHVVMEVSSHALDQGRVQDCPFKVRVFTNLSRDHLDYHRTMEDYFQAKARLFKVSADYEIPGITAVINMDSPEGKRLLGLTKIPAISYGLNAKAHVRAEQINSTREGMEFRLKGPQGEADIFSPLLGEFNIYNILAASSAAMALGVDLEGIKRGIKAVKCIPGRMERVDNAKGLFIVVDYAHTPEALSRVLEALRPLVTGRIITVFGCGGDRDKGKRAMMGQVALLLSDMVIITSDNPRTEDPISIISAIEDGVAKSGAKCPYDIHADRKEAIKAALQMAGPDDLVLIAGKGHEDYQIIGTTTRPFDDRKVARELASTLPG